MPIWSLDSIEPTAFAHQFHMKMRNATPICSNHK